MNSTQSPETPPLGTKGQILFIEPDLRRATELRDILRQHDDIDVEIVESVPAALQALAVQIPDLLLTSTFLPPGDEAVLIAHVNQVPGARHLQAITVPYFIDAEERTGSDAANARVLTFLRRRPVSVRPRCDVRTLLAQIEEYLAQARMVRLEAGRQEPVDALYARDDGPAERQRIHEASRTRTGEATGAANGSSIIQPAVFGRPADRRRAPRRASADVPWLWSVKIPGGSQVSIVDISSTGVLLETSSRMADGYTVDLQLVGQDTNVTVPARMVRTQVAAVTGLGVKYRVAAAFAHELALPGLLRAPGTTPMPKVLGELLTRMLSDIDGSSGPAAVRANLERELRSILPVRDIQIRQTPVLAEPGAESVVFTVPHRTQPILQAIFEPDYAPSAMDLRLLKAAASVAAIVLEFAPPAC